MQYKFLIPVFVFLLLAVTVFGISPQSSDENDYYSDSFHPLAGFIGNSLSWNQSVVADGQSTSEGGWTDTGTSGTYRSILLGGRTMSLQFDSLSEVANYVMTPQNGSFTGIVGFIINDTSVTLDHLWSVGVTFFGGGGASIFVDTRDDPDLYLHDGLNPCDLNTIFREEGNETEIIFNWTSTTSVTAYINGVPCHVYSTGGGSGLRSIGMGEQGLGSNINLSVTNIWVASGNSSPEPPAGVAGQAELLIGSFDNYKNSFQEQEAFKFFVNHSFDTNNSAIKDSACTVTYLTVPYTTIFNVSSNFYESNTSTLSEASGENATASCDNSDDSLDATDNAFLNITNIVPSVDINFLLLEETTTINDTLLNSLRFFHGNMTVNVTVSDNDLTNFTVQFLNNSGDVISSTFNQSSFNVSSLLFVDFHQSPYNMTLQAFDGDGDNNITYALLNFTDDFPPTTTGIVNASVNFNGTYNFEVIFSDEHFFSYNVTCTDGFNSSESGLNVKSFNFTGSLTGIVENVTCTWTYCDGHTAQQLLKDWTVKESRNELEFRIGIDQKRTLRVESEQNFSMSYEQKRDRITFTIGHPDKRAGLKTYTLLYEASPNSYYFPSDEYTAWIADAESRTWFDLNGIDGIITVFRRNETLWELEIETFASEITAESIGEFNCVTETNKISIPQQLQGILQVGQCPTGSVQSVLMFAFLFMVLLSLFVLNLLYIKFPFLDLAAGIGMIFYSLALIGCNQFIGATALIFGLGMVAMAFADKK